MCINPWWRLSFCHSRSGVFPGCAYAVGKNAPSLLFILFWNKSERKKYSGKSAERCVLCTTEQRSDRTAAGTKHAYGGVLSVRFCARRVPQEATRKTNAERSGRPVFLSNTYLPDGFPIPARLFPRCGALSRREGRHAHPGTRIPPRPPLCCCQVLVWVARARPPTFCRQDCTWKKKDAAEGPTSARKGEVWLGPSSCLHILTRHPRGYLKGQISSSAHAML